jgi:sirohydrochlorin ferrochelatase
LHLGSRKAAEGLAEQFLCEGYRSARSVFLEEEPKISEWRGVVAEEGPVIVLPHFLAGGLHGSEDVPGLVGLASAEEGWSELDERKIGYGEPLGKPEEMEEIVIQLARSI